MCLDRSNGNNKMEWQQPGEGALCSDWWSQKPEKLPPIKMNLQNPALALVDLKKKIQPIVRENF